MPASDGANPPYNRPHPSCFTTYIFFQLQNKNKFKKKKKVPFGHREKVVKVHFLSYQREYKQRENINIALNYYLKNHRARERET